MTMMRWVRFPLPALYNKEITVFKTRSSRSIIGFLLLVLFNFTCFWIITDDPVEAAQGLLLLYFALGGMVTTWFVISDWIARGEE